MNEALYGHNQDEGIVCIDVWGNTVSEFIQQEDGNIVCNEIRNFEPWYLVHSLKPNLSGENHFNTILRTTLKDFKYLYDQKEHIEDMLLVGNKADNYMIETGQTLFKEMNFDEVHTVGFDIETTGLSPETCEVKMVSVVDNRGFSKVIYSQDEREVIREFVKLIQRLDPTILLGYNCFPKNTKILLDNGTEKNINQIYEGDIVCGIDIKQTVTQLHKTSFNDYGYKIHTKSGKVIECTPDHPLFGSINNYFKIKMKYGTPLQLKDKTDYISAKDFKVGDYLAIPRKLYTNTVQLNCVDIINDFTVDKQTILKFKEYKPYGFMTKLANELNLSNSSVWGTDGYFWKKSLLKKYNYNDKIYGTRWFKDFKIDEYDLYCIGLIYTDGTINKNGFSFYNTNIKLVEYVQKWLLNRFNINNKISFYIHNNVNHNDRYTIQTNNKIVNKFLRYFGITERKSNINHDTNLSNIYQLDEQLIGAFLAGCIDGDGCIYKRISIACNSKKGMEWYNKLFRRLRIVTYQVDDNIFIYTSNINISEYTKYIHQYIIQKKDIPLNIDSRGQWDIQPYNQLKYVNQDKIPNTTYQYYKYKRTKLPTKLCNKLDYPDIWWDEIINIEQVYLDEVYNIGTLPTHNYIANGIHVHNCFRFDIPFLMKRAELHEIDFGIGRNGASPIPTKIMVRMGVGQQDYQQAWRIWGRHCIDLYYSVIRYDFTDRKLNNYKLKNVIQQYGLEKDDRVHVGYQEIFDAMESGDPTELNRIKEYCLADSEDLINLHNHICQADFYLTQIIPMNYQRLMYSGSVGRINNLMIRDYLYNITSIPVWRLDKFYIEGAEVQAEHAGVFKYVGDSDITSMYPNLMIQNDIFPKTDTLHTMKRTLVDLKDARIATKRLAKKEQDLIRKQLLNGQQLAMKILINSYFGVLGSPGFFWRDNDKCASVTKHGRELIIKMRDYIESIGYTVVTLDTDGIAYTNGEPIDIDDINDKIQSILPEGIDVESQIYKGIAVFKKKTYAVLKDDGTITPKGAALTSSSMSPLVKQFINKAMEILFKITFNEDNYDSLKAYYDVLIDNIHNNTLPIEQYTMIQRVVKDIDEYRDLKGTPTEKGGTRAKLPLYELMLQTERKLSVGEKTETYWSAKEIIKPLTAAQQRKRDQRDLTAKLFEIEEKPKTQTIKVLKWLDQYDSDNPDIFINHYIDSLNNRIYDLLGLIIPKDVFFNVFSRMIELHNKARKETFKESEIIENFIYKDFWGVGHKTWQRVTLDDERELIAKSGEDLYITIQRFANDKEVGGELTYHPIYFDLDSEFVDESLQEAQSIFNIFTNVLQVKPEYITVWFSGSKGFHIEVSPKVFRINPMAGLTLINKEIARWLTDYYHLKTIDMGSIYSSRRMWRLPFTVHSKTKLRKTWIPNIKQFDNLVQLMKYVNDHQDLKTEYNAYFEWVDSVHPKVNPHILKWFKEFEDRYRNDLAREVIRKPSWKYKKLKGKLPNCIEYLRKHSINESGHRNNATITLLTFFKESGMEMEKAIENVVNWTLRIPEGLTSAVNYGIIKKNVGSVANRVYKDDTFGKKYVFECGYIKSLIKSRGFECPTICTLKD